jgi:hypothetical protein
VTGSPDLVRAAQAQCRTGKPGAPALVDYAGKTVASSQVWAIAQGGITLPVTGNTRNLNRLFRNLDYAALSLDLNSALDVRLTAQGRTEQASREFEENLRAILSLASAAESRNPQIASLLASVQIQRASLTTTAKLTAPSGTVQTLLSHLTPAF